MRGKIEVSGTPSFCYQKKGLVRPERFTFALRRRSALPRREVCDLPPLRLLSWEIHVSMLRAYSISPVAGKRGSAKNPRGTDHLLGICALANLWFPATVPPASGARPRLERGRALKLLLGPVSVQAFLFLTQSRSQLKRNMALAGSLSLPTDHITSWADESHAPRERQRGVGEVQSHCIQYKSVRTLSPLL